MLKQIVRITTTLSRVSSNHLFPVYGGAISSIPADATAFAHRDAFLVYQFYANTANQLPPFPDDGVSFVNGMLTALEPQPRAAYPNYIDPILSSNDWQSLYFGSNIDRLKKIKEDIDPGNVFNFQQVIPMYAKFANTPILP